MNITIFELGINKYLIFKTYARTKKRIKFLGQNIYVRINVHLKSWNVTILTDHLHHKTFTQPPSVSFLVLYLTHNFLGGVYQSAYEAGFSGLCTHYELIKMGVNNIVVNPANLPTTQKENYKKRTLWIAVRLPVLCIQAS